MNIFNITPKDATKLKTYLVNVFILRPYYELLDKSLATPKYESFLLKQETDFLNSKKEVVRSLMNKETFNCMPYYIPGLFDVFLMARICPECANPLIVECDKRFVNKTCLVCGEIFNYEICYISASNLNNIEFEYLMTQISDMPPWDTIKNSYEEKIKNIITWLSDDKKNKDKAKISAKQKLAQSFPGECAEARTEWEFVDLPTDIYSNYSPRVITNTAGNNTL